MIGEKDKAKLIPISIKKKTSVSKSGKGVVVRQPVSIEDKNQNEPDKDKGTSDKNTEEEDCWNGTKNGKELPVASYHYVITFQNDGKKHRLTGIITILR